jgi:hypothetical protein
MMDASLTWEGIVWTLNRGKNLALGQCDGCACDAADLAAYSATDPAGNEHSALWCEDCIFEIKLDMENAEADRE